MKPLYLAILFLATLTSCNDTGKRDASLLKKSVGNINRLLVITPNDFWNAEVGEAIRDYFAAPVEGLPQDEPMFSMNQMPPETFSDFARSNRIFLQVGIGKEDKVVIKNDVYAKPQVGAYIVGTSKESIIKLIEENYKQIIESFHETELMEKQRRINVSLMKLDSLQSKLGVKLRVPSAYHIAKQNDTFFWLRKELKEGNNNIMVYTAPMNMIGKDSTVVADIIKIRDSIGSKLLPVEDDDLFITEEAYAPYFFNSSLDGRPAYETKGIWEVKGAWMSGPFVNYIVKDEKHNRYIVLEGFTHAPSVEKRDLQFELQAILNSAKFE